MSKVQFFSTTDPPLPYTTTCSEFDPSVNKSLCSSRAPFTVRGGGGGGGGRKWYTLGCCSGTSLNRIPLGQSKMSLIERCPHFRGCFKYTNDVFGTEKSVLFMEVSSIQGCPYRGVPLYKYIYSVILNIGAH